MIQSTSTLATVNSQLLVNLIQESGDVLVEAVTNGVLITPKFSDSSLSVPVLLRPSGDDEVIVSVYDEEVSMLEKILSSDFNEDDEYFFPIEDLLSLLEEDSSALSKILIILDAYTPSRTINVQNLISVIENLKDSYPVESILTEMVSMSREDLENLCSTCIDSLTSFNDIIGILNISDEDDEDDEDDDEEPNVSGIVSGFHFVEETRIAKSSY